MGWRNKVVSLFVTFKTFPFLLHYYIIYFYFCFRHSRSSIGRQFINIFQFKEIISVHRKKVRLLMMNLSIRWKILLAHKTSWNQMKYNPLSVILRFNPPAHPVLNQKDPDAKMQSFRRHWQWWKPLLTYWELDKLKTQHQQK